MTHNKARVVLFCIWVALLVVYFIMFLLTGLKAGITIEQAGESCWKIIYVILPVLSAFASFWFLPKARPTNDVPDLEPVEFTTLLAMFVVTGVFHALVLLYFLIAVLMPDFGFDDGDPKSYAGRVDFGVKLLVVFSAILVLPVGYVLGTPVPLATNRPGNGATPASNPQEL
jgi:hypothetical protein